MAWLFYLSGDPHEREEATDLLDILLYQSVGKDYTRQIILDPPAPTRCAGEYGLGTVLYPPGQAYAAFGLREEEWIKHILITGMTGTGKTNLGYHLVRTLRAHGKPVLVFDWKRNYRALRDLPDCRDVLVYTVGQGPFRFNPLLPPPGTPPGEWLSKLVDVLKHAYFVGEGVEYVLRGTINQVYERCGLYDGRVHDTPTFHEVRALVIRERLQGRMGLWKASALRVLETLCFPHGLGPVVNTPRQWDHHRYLTNTVILELDTLADADKGFLTEALILWLYELRKHETRGEFKHALLIEEAHHILSREKEAAAGIETIMETSLRQIREYGEAVIAIDQEPSKLSDSIKANTHTKITFNLGNNKDLIDAASNLGLTHDEAPAINLLTVGHALISVKERIPAPIHVRFPRVVVGKRVVTDRTARGAISRVARGGERAKEDS